LVGVKTGVPNYVPIPNVTVTAYLGGNAPCCQVVATARTEANGGYNLNLPAGVYRIQYSPSAASGFAEQWIDSGTSFNTGRDVVVPTLGRYDLNPRLVGIYTMSGRVTSRATGAGIQGAEVTAYLDLNDPSLTCDGLPVSTARTDAFGAYLLPSLATQTYRVRFFPPSSSDSSRQWWNQAQDCASATELRVRGNLTSIDGSL
jgi:hypothetical protein